MLTKEGAHSFPSKSLRQAAMAFVLVAALLALTSAALFQVAHAGDVGPTFFMATAQDETILLEWHTSSEANSLGFNIYRAETDDTGSAIQINTDLIPCQSPGGSGGASYELVDQDATTGVTYYYWLETLNVYGGGEQLGPVSAKLSMLRRLLLARPRPVIEPPILRTR